jgi:filamentous hemagglutinin family protein
MVAVVAVPLSLGSASAQIATDNSFGPAQTLSGPEFSIGSALGMLSGNNLFHSFSVFNLETGQSATFTGPSSLANIIARVTGGTGSSIDGTIATLTGGSPNLFLINPAGVIFGPNASLDVEGSFHVSTADYLKFADGVKYMSNLGNGSSFSTAEPAAFGFLNANPLNPPAVEIDGSVLNVGTASTMNLVGGEVQITGGRLTAPGGAIAATAVASFGELPLDPIAFESATVEASGNAAISGGAVLDASDPSALAPAAGSIYVRAGTVTIDDSGILADNHGTDPGGTVVLAGKNQTTITNGSSVSSTAYAEGSGAAIALIGGDITVSQDSDVFTLTTNWFSSMGVVAGDAGPLTVTAETITVTGGSSISSATQGAGNGGNIVVDVTGALEIGGNSIDDQGQIRSNTYGSGNSGDITVSSGTLTITGLLSVIGAGTASVYGGDAGQVTISAESITLSEGGQIESSTAGPGNGGNITIHATKSLEVYSNPDEFYQITGIFADSFGSGDYFDAAGDAGKITIDAGSITIGERGRISSGSARYGNGGDITVNSAGALTISGYSSGISVSTTWPDGGDAGAITVNADSIMLADGASITSSTAAAGNGGDIVVHTTNALEIGGNALTGIYAESYGYGDGGTISVDAGNITIEGLARISSSTFGSGNGGDVTVNSAGALTITGDPAAFFATGISANTYAVGQDGVPGGDAGQVTVRADNITIADGGQVSSSTSGSGHGGNILVEAVHALDIHEEPYGLLLTGIFADSYYYDADSVPTGDAGNINVDAGSVTIGGTGQVSSTTSGSGSAGNVAVTADTITITDGIIDSSTFGSGSGGNVVVTAIEALEIHGDVGAGIRADSLPWSATGDAGTITVNAGHIVLDGAAEVSSSTYGAGQGGDIAVSADSIALTSGGAIASFSDGSGDAGNIVINATGGLSIAGFSEINTTSYGTDGIVIGIVDDTDRTSATAADVGDGGGDAGQITINAGSVALSDGALILSQGLGRTGGNIALHVTGALEIHGNTNPLTPTGISADTSDYYLRPGGDAGTITIDASSVTIDGFGQIESNTYGTGNGGDVTVNAVGAVVITGHPDADFSTGIAANTYSITGGNAGEVTVNAGSIMIADSGQIATSTSGAGNGGNVLVHATGTLEIDGSPNAQAPTGISADSLPGATGHAGKITIDADSVIVHDAGQVTTNTAGSGTAGDVAIDASSVMLASRGAIFSNTSGSGEGGSVAVNASGTLTITGDPDSEFFTGISAGAASDGDAGQVTVNAGSIMLSDSGQIASSTSGAGNGGDVTVDAIGTVEIVGNANAANPTGIVAGSLPGATGDAGQITVHADSLTLTDAGQIATNSSGPGVAGDILIKAQQVVIDNSTISSDSAGTGSSGSVVIDPTSILITNGATVSAKATGGGVSGDVVLFADMITIDNSVVSTESESGGGGNIQITASNLLYIVNGEVTATVQNGDLDAGNITIYAGLLVLDQSVLSANAFEGKGGNLHVTANGLIASQDSIISASSERGVNGLVDIDALSNDVTSGLVELSDALVQDASRLACTSAPSGPQDPFSSVVVHGRGEYDFDPDAPGAASYGTALVAADQTERSRRGEIALASQSSCDR